MIWSSWPSWFVQQVGGVPVDRYLCFDLEAMGADVSEALIWQVGHVLVSDGQVIDRFSAILDWSSSSLLTAETVQEMLARHYERSLGGDKMRDRLNWDRLVSEGQPPEMVLTRWGEMFRKLASAGFKFVGHNVCRYDQPVLQRHWNDWDLLDFTFGENDVFDTCVLEKLNQLQGDARTIPRPGESLHDYNLRCAPLGGSKLLANLQGHCVTKYNLRPRVVSKRDRGHHASFDAYLCYQLMEVYRQMYQADLRAAQAPRKRRQLNY